MHVKKPFARDATGACKWGTGENSAIMVSPSRCPQTRSISLRLEVQPEPERQFGCSKSVTSWILLKEETYVAVPLMYVRLLTKCFVVCVLLRSLGRLQGASMVTGLIYVSR